MSTCSKTAREVPTVLLVGSCSESVAWLHAAFQGAVPRANIVTCHEESRASRQLACSHADAVVLVRAVRRETIELSLLRQLRASARHSSTPFVLVSHLDHPDLLTTFYASGGDAWLPLLDGSDRAAALALRCVLRRGRVAGHVASRAHSVELSSSQRVVRIGSAVSELTASQFALLRCLADNSDRLVPTAELLAAIRDSEGAKWGAGSGGTGSLYELVSKTRLALDPHGDVIKTVRGAGYGISPEYLVTPR